MKKFIALVGLLFLIHCASKSNSSTSPEMAAVALPDGFIIQTELANDDMTRSQGLMFRKSMPYDHGMLFIYETPSQGGFWMKNCHFPLDLVWLDKDGKVLGITASAQPCPGDPCPTYPAPTPYMQVLEVNGGFMEAHHVQTGDRLFIEMPTPPSSGNRP